MRKIITLGIMLLFLGMTISSSTGLYLNEQSIKTLSSGNILYVGGNGTGNYTKIQDAIDDASYGDTVFVYDDSSPYYENIVVDKSINLIGEDRDTTIIRGPLVFSIDSNNVNIQSFTIIAEIIFENSSNCTFYNNNVQTEGPAKSVLIYYSSEINIIKNYITSHWLSIEVSHSRNCIIENNYIVSNEMEWSQIGIGISNSTNITIIHNHISRWLHGIVMRNPGTVDVIQNNFIGNIRHARFESRNFFNIFWDGNYWGRPRLLPCPILGWLFILPIVHFDWHPAKEPYDIEV